MNKITAKLTMVCHSFKSPHNFASLFSFLWLAQGVIQVIIYSAETQYYFPKVNTILALPCVSVTDSYNTDKTRIPYFLHSKN